MSKESDYQAIMLAMYEIMDSVGGEYIDVDEVAPLQHQKFHELLIDIFDLPEDHHLLSRSS
jgi:hypothetical protein